MKIKFITTAVLVAGLLVSGSFAADRHVRLGGNLALGYNTVAGLDEKNVIETKTLSKDPFSKTQMEKSIKGIDGLSGFGFELGGSVDFPINDKISLRANLLMGYHTHSNALVQDSSIVKYSDNTASNAYKRMSAEPHSRSIGEHSFDQFNLEIPVLCRIILPTGDENGFYAEAGLVFDLNLSTSTDDFVVKPEYVNGFSMGISVGAGRPLPINVPVDIDVHMVFGVMSMANDKYFNPTDILIRVGATYWFL